MSSTAGIRANWHGPNAEAHLSRRQVMRAGLLAAGAGCLTCMPSWAQRSATGVSDIVVGQTAILSGPLGVAVRTFNAGADLAFSEKNRSGGIQGRLVRLVSMDDGLSPERAQANVASLIERNDIVSLFGAVGSATVSAIAPLLKKSGLPLVGNFALSDSARQSAAGSAYFVRATYSREAQKLIQHLTTIGVRRVAVAHLANPGGEEVFKYVLQEASKQGLPTPIGVAVQGDASNVDEAVRAISGAEPQALILFISGPYVSDLLRQVLSKGKSPMCYGMSILAADTVAASLGRQLRGLAISQVVPYPWDVGDLVATRYRSLCVSHSMVPSYTGYEGYLNGLVLLECMARMTERVSPAGVHAVMRSFRQRIGEFDIDFRGAESTGSRFVELVNATAEGRYIR